MSKRPPILITGAGGEVGSVSRTMTHMLLEQQYPVRAFVRRDDERAGALRTAGAQVFVGDLLKCRRCRGRPERVPEDLLQHELEPVL
jgi:NAD(P)H dehydrogenase (quinone)